MSSHSTNHSNTEHERDASEHTPTSPTYTPGHYEETPEPLSSDEPMEDAQSIEDYSENSEEFEEENRDEESEPEEDPTTIPVSPTARQETPTSPLLFERIIEMDPYFQSFHQTTTTSTATNAASTSTTTPTIQVRYPPGVPGNRLRRTARKSVAFHTPTHHHDPSTPQESESQRHRTTNGSQWQWMPDTFARWCREEEVPPAATLSPRPYLLPLIGATLECSVPTLASRSFRHEQRIHANTTNIDDLQERVRRLLTHMNGKINAIHHKAEMARQRADIALQQADRAQVEREAMRDQLMDAWEQADIARGQAARANDRATRAEEQIQTMMARQNGAS